MDSAFVFQHSLMAVSDLEYYSIDELFSGNEIRPIDHDLLGNHCLFRVDKNEPGLNFGYLAMDLDLNLDDVPSINQLQKVKFPKAEYHFAIHNNPFSEIKNTFSTIDKKLYQENLHSVMDPILVFPRGMPRTLDDPTTIEIWTATNADFQAEQRRSDNIEEALPRKSFNFYTW